MQRYGFGFFPMMTVVTNRVAAELYRLLFGITAAVADIRVEGGEARAIVGDIRTDVGAASVVRATGGLADTVFDANHADKPYEERTGYTFDTFDTEGLESALGRAIGLWYKYPRYFHQLRVNGMRRDYSWHQPGTHYLNIYEHIRAR